MILLIDSREQNPLEFSKLKDVEVKTVGLPVGDYGAMHGEVRDLSVIERKSVSDLFHSFTSNYEAERDKILRAKELGLTYILAIESPFLEILKGHSYWRDGESHEVQRTGISMVRTLFTVMRKYGIMVWFFNGRKEMAWAILEYFLTAERAIQNESFQEWTSSLRSQAPSLEGKPRKLLP